MILGILRMPLPDNPEDCGIVTWLQMKDIMREAANRIESDSRRIAELEAALKPFAGFKVITISDLRQASKALGGKE